MEETKVVDNAVETQEETPERDVLKYSENQMDELIQAKITRSDKRDAKAKKELLDQYGIDEDQLEGYKTFVENQKTTQEKLQEQVDAFLIKESEWKSKAELQEAKDIARELGINLELIDQATMLAKSSMSGEQTLLDGFTYVRDNIGGKFLTQEPKNTKIELGGNILNDNTETKEKVNKPNTEPQIKILV